MPWGGLCHRHVPSGQRVCVFVVWMGLRPGPGKWPDLGQDYRAPHPQPAALLEPDLPLSCPVPRLRSVKIEQGKVNDQANTLAELAKVSRAGQEGRAGPSGDAGSVSSQRGWDPQCPCSAWLFSLNS